MFYCKIQGIMWCVCEEIFEFKKKASDGNIVRLSFLFAWSIFHLDKWRKNWSFLFKYKQRISLYYSTWIINNISAFDGEDILNM
jgi:hypothetical protein